MSLYENDLYEEIFATRQRPLPEENQSLSRRKKADDSDYAELQFND